jgi:hypothetical protein
MATLLFYACLLQSVSSQTHMFVPLSPAPPSTVVVWGDARFSFLSDTLVRLELAGNLGGYDDRQSFAIVNRSALPPPAITVSTLGNTLTVKTEALTLTYYSPSGNTTSGGGGGSNHTCPQIQNADVTGSFSRVPDYPKGTIVKAVGDCCLLCGATRPCNAWVFDPNATADPGADPFGTNCWLLSGTAALRPNSRRMGGLFNLPSFNASNLNISFSSGGEVVTWNPSLTSDKDPGQLKGVYRANDCYAVPSQCISVYESSFAPGLLSQSGWALLDDSLSARFVPTAEGPSPIPYWYANASASNGPQADLYLFAGGLNYSKTLYEYSRVGGAISLPPRSVFGVWWSHWQPFTQEEFVDTILGGYANFSLPLDHAVLDVDWHTEETGNASVPCYSYGGWTVNTALWPQWESFLDDCHSGTNPTGYKLKVLLNLHPQGGFDACQKYWPAFSALTGYTDASRILPCTFGIQKIAAATFTAYMDYAELSTVDAWWVDFDYVGDCFDAPSSTLLHSGYPGLAWSNEVFAGHNVVRGRRPLVLSRSGGIGDHRNPVRFTGDANQHREILKWEMFATPTSANALFNT